MSDFYSKLRANVPTVSILPSDAPPAHPISNITMIGGQQLTVPSFQVPKKNPYINSNLWRYPASGSFTNILSTGGQVQIPIIKGTGSGHTQQVWLRIKVINSTGSDVEMIPAPVWIQSHMFQTPSGATIQTQQGTQLWTSIATTTTLEDWYEVSRAVGSSLDYEAGDAVPNGATVTYYIPLIGSFLSAGQFFTPATSGDIQYYVTFWPDSVIRNTGTAALTVQEMSLDIKMEQMAPPLLSATITLFANKRFDYIIPYFKNQPFSFTQTAGQQYINNLSNISGDVVFIDFVIRRSYVGNDLIHYLPVANFQYQNQEGIGISSQQFIDDSMSRDIIFPPQNKGTYTRNRRFYRHVFSECEDAVSEMLLYGRKTGAYPFDNHCNLVFNAAAAGADEMWQLAAFGPTPTAGNCLFTWITPDDGVAQSAQVPFSDLTGTAPFTNLQNAIQAISNFDGTITVGGGYATTGLTFTFGGTYGNRALAAEGYALQINMGTLNAGAGQVCQGYLYQQNAGALGITSGTTYNLDVYAVTSGVVSILPDGSMKAYNS